MSDVFISHIQDDADEAIAIAQELAAAGFSTWYYEEHSLPGSPYLAQVGEAIDRCKAVVVVISVNALGSNQVTNEIVRAYEGGKQFVPVLHGISHLEFQERQPIWRQALGASTSINIPQEGVAEIAPRIMAGLQAMGVESSGADDGSEAAGSPKATAESYAPATRKPGPEPSRRQRAATVAGAAAALVLAVAYYLVSLSDGTPPATEDFGPLRRAIRAALSEGDWAAADSNIAQYVTKSPDTSAVTEWRRQLAGGRERSVRNLEFRVLKTSARSVPSGMGIVFAPDGQHILTTTTTYDIAVWERSDGRLAGTLAGHTDWVRTVALTPDGRYVVSGGQDETVRVWRLADRTLVRTIYGHEGTVRHVAVTPDGRRIVSCGEDSTIRVWLFADGTPADTMRGHTGMVRCLATTTDGQYVVSASIDSTVRIWDLSDGKLVRTMSGHQGAVTSVVVTPDGEQLVSASGSTAHGGDSTIRVWRLADGVLERTIPIPAKPNPASICVSPNGQHVLAACGDSITILELATGRAARAIPVDMSQNVAVDPNGAYVASVGYSTLNAWRYTDGFLLWDSRDAEGSHGEPVTDLAVTPDGRYVLSSSEDETTKMWQLPRGEPVRTMVGHTAPVTALAVSADGRHFVSGSPDGSIRMWRISDGREVSRFHHGSKVWDVALDAEGAHAISCGADCTIVVWRLRDGARLRTMAGHTLDVHAVDITPDGRHVVSCSRDSTIRLWRLSDGRLLRTFRGQGASVYAVAAMADGRHVAAGSGDGRVIVWDLEDGTRVAGTGHHDARVFDIAIHPDAQHVISVSLDWTIRAWKLAPHARTGLGFEYVRTLETDRLSTALAFTPDGRRMISGGADGALRIWGVP